jgi:hypothetical protein
MSSKIIL